VAKAETLADTMVQMEAQEVALVHKEELSVVEQLDKVTMVAHQLAVQPLAAAEVVQSPQEVLVAQAAAEELEP
jgi:hypothetical protein